MHKRILVCFLCLTVYRDQNMRHFILVCLFCDVDLNFQSVKVLLMQLFCVVAWIIFEHLSKYCTYT